METLHYFTKGMDQDTSRSKVQNGFWYNLTNGSIVTDQGLSTGDVTTMKGNLEFFSFPGTSDVWILTGNTDTFDLTINGNTETFIYSISDQKRFFEAIKQQINTSLLFGVQKIKAAYNSDYLYIWSEDPISITASVTGSMQIFQSASAQTGLFPIGYVSIRDSFYILTTNNSSTSLNSLGQWWKFTYNKFNFSSTLELLYNNYLNVSSAFPVANPGMIEGRYENPNLIHAYWTENNTNGPRTINFADPNLFAVDTTVISLNARVQMSSPILQEIQQSGGGLLAGMHQVGYSLKNIAGAETTISVLTPMIYLTDKSDTSDDLTNYDGCPQGTNTFKSLRFKIDNLDNDYSLIEIIHVFKDSENGTPVIKSVITSSFKDSFEFTVTGNEDAIPLTLLELNLRTVNFDRVGTLASKKNYLFLGDVSLKKIDINYDARAFRYLPASEWASPTAPETYTHDALPETDNDINPNQSPVYDPTSPDGPSYLYQIDGTTFGGSGPNISYSFITEDLLTDENFQSILPNSAVPHRNVSIETRTYDFSIPNQTHINNNAFPDFASPYIAADFKGYLRDETYPFAIVFYDKQGNPGFAKWIADIRFPHVYMPDIANPLNRVLTYPTSSYDSTNEKAYVKPLGIKFSVSIPIALKNLISGFSIVRCERTDSDKTILGQGALLYSTYDPTSDIHFLPSYELDAPQDSGPGDYSKDIMSMQSPDFLFEKFGGYNNGDQIDVIGLLESVYESNQTKQEDSSDAGIDNRMCKNYQFKSSPAPIVNANSNNPYTLTDSKDIPNWYTAPNTITLGTTKTKNQGIYNYDYSVGGKTTALKGNFDNFANNINYNIANPNPNWFYLLDSVVDTYDVYLCNYRRNVPLQYGGNTLIQRSNRQYINCSGFYPVTDSNIGTNVDIKVYQGDTFVTIFDNIKEFRNKDFSGTRRSLVRLFPVETSINTNLRENFSDDLVDPTRKLVPNRENMPDVAYGNEGLAIEEFFGYNEAYSAEDNSKVFLSKNPLVQEILDYDVRVYRSEAKSNGELKDSWGVFKENNYLDLDSKYGKLFSLIERSNDFMFFQQDAFGKVSVQDRSVIQDNTGATLVLGTGGVLDRFDYISNNIGCRHKFSIQNGLEGTIIYDAGSKTFYLTNGDSAKPLTGLSGYFNNNLQGDITVNDNPFLKKGIHCIYDYKYKQFYITAFNETLTGSNTSFTVSYSDVLQAFHSFHSFQPVLYMGDRDNIISFEKGLSKGWIHDRGTYGNYYGVQYGMNIHFITNSPVEAIWNNLELNTICLAGSTNNNFSINQDKTFDFLLAWNDYQFNGFVPLIPGTNLKRIKKVWNTAIGTNRVKDSTKDMFNFSNLYLYPDRPANIQRIKSDHLNINLSFTNTQNYKLILKSVLVKSQPNSR